MDAFKEYIAMWKNYVNFSDRTTVRGYWMAYLWNFLAAAVCAGIDQLLGTGFIASLYGLAVLLPGLAIFVRRMKDCGRSWANIFWSLLPIVGWIIVIIRLCQASVPADGTPVV